MVSTIQTTHICIKMGVSDNFQNPRSLQLLVCTCSSSSQVLPRDTQISDLDLQPLQSLTCKLLIHGPRDDSLGPTSRHPQASYQTSPSHPRLPQHSGPLRCLLPVPIVPKDICSSGPKLWALHEVAGERLWFCRQYCRRTPEEEACCSPFRDTGSVPPSLFLKYCLKLAPFSTLLQSHFKKDESIEDYKKSYTENCTQYMTNQLLELAECTEEL